MRYLSFSTLFSLLACLWGCQQKPSFSQIQLTFPLWVRQTSAIEKAFESGGILLKIKVETVGGDPRKMQRLLKSQEELDQLSLPLDWFQDEGDLKFEAVVEWSIKEPDDMTKRFLGQVVLDMDSLERAELSPIQVFLQEQAGQEQASWQ